MTLDKNSLERILKLPDDQLIMIIKTLASQNGIDAKNINISKAELSALRKALSGIEECDVKKAAEIFKSYKNGK